MEAQIGTRQNQKFAGGKNVSPQAKKLVGKKADLRNKLPPNPISPLRPRKRKRGRSLVILSFVFFVIMPTALVALYYLYIAEDQYVVATRFAVRNSNVVDSSGVLSALGLGIGGGSLGDSYIILEYIHSRQILEKIDSSMNLRQRYERPRRDFYARLPKDIPFEEFVKYWKSMVDVNLDRTSLIMTVKVYAFTAEDARDISLAILSESERMINEINERAREDALAYAKEEVRKAENRLRKVRQRFLEFRNTTLQVDPTKQVQVQLALIGKLEEQVASLQARLIEVKSYLNEKAPSVISLKNRIIALKRQIKKEKSKLGEGNNKSMIVNEFKDSKYSKIISEYESLLVEREFAEKYYLSALSALEQARIIANKQQRYLATFVKPYLPDEALYPKRLRNTFFIFIISVLLWALSLLMMQSIRDRM